MKSVSGIVRVVGVAAMLSAATLGAGGIAGASTGAKVAVPTFSVTKAWPANAAVAALLPQGPQHVSLEMSIGKGRDKTIVAESGYIDFTGGAEGGCSYQISLRETFGGAVKLTTSKVRDPYGVAYEELLSGKNEGRLDTWDAAGYPWSAFGNGPVYVPGTSFGFDAQPIGPNQGAGWCRFDDVANYTTLVPGADRLRVNIGRMATINKKAARYNAARLVNALGLSSQAKATASVALIDELAVPTFSSAFDGITWHLSKSHGVVTFSVEPKVAGALSSVVIFTPTSTQSVPSIHSTSPAAEEIAGLGGKKNFFKNLFTLGGKPSTETPATDAAISVASYAVATSVDFGGTAVTLPKLKTAIGTADGGVSLVKTRTSGKIVTWAEMRVKTARHSYSDVCVKFGLKVNTPPVVVKC